MTQGPKTMRDLARRWGMPAALALLAVGAELGGDAARAALRYQRDAILDGELWRLLTGNLAHLGPRHLALNLAGLALVAGLGGRALEGARGAVVAIAAMLGVGLGLLALEPGVAWYVGLSGALHGLLAALVLDAVAERDDRGWAVALGVALAAKLAWEQLAGPLPFTAEAAAGPVIVAAHLHGAVAGALASVAWSLGARVRRGPQV